jgi:serralysin
MTEVIGGITNDTLTGSTGTDVIFGKGGADTVNGGAGNDVLYGDSKSKGLVKPTGFDIVADVNAKVTFITESAGHKNTLGMYVINEDGSMGDVQILFANASLKGSGGDLQSGVSNAMRTLAAGQKVGFFIASNGFTHSPAALSATDGHYELRDSGGKIAKISDGADVALYHVNDAGLATLVNTQYGSSLFFTNAGQNADGLGHVRIVSDVKTGIVKIGFEDLLNGGDRDFDDVVVTIDVGITNAAIWGDVEPPKVIENRNDVVNAGDGNDIAYGNAGNDKLNGESGNDSLDGGSGNDTLSGGAGDDVIYGRSGDDAIYGDDGNDYLDGTGRDQIWAGAGNDNYNGGDGFDIIDFSASRTGLTLDVSKKTAISGLGDDVVSSFEHFIGTRYNDSMRGDKAANTFVGGDGDDWFRGLGGSDLITGGNGKDTFAYSAKDVWFEKEHLGVDRIRDFNFKVDKLDVHEITKNFLGEKLELIKLEQDDSGTMIWANLGVDAEWQQVVHLDKVSVDDISASMRDWLIL